MACFHKVFACILLAGFVFMASGCSHLDNNRAMFEQASIETEQREIDNDAEKTLETPANEAIKTVENKSEKPVEISQKMSNIDTSILEEVSADCIFSIGIACRPSGHLRDLNLRFQAAPLDWMTSHSLSAVAHLFETGFEDFFADIKEVPAQNGAKYRCVRDVKNDIISMHHFAKGVSLEEAQRQFRDTMLNRASKVDKIFKDSSSIVLLCNRNKNSAEELIDFLNRFAAVYPDKKVTLINIYDERIDGFKKEILLEGDNLKIVQYSFNDNLASGNSADGWKGNIEAWTGIIKSIKLSDKFYNEAGKEVAF